MRQWGLRFEAEPGNHGVRGVHFEPLTMHSREVIAATIPRQIGRLTGIVCITLEPVPSRSLSVTQVLSYQHEIRKNETHILPNIPDNPQARERKEGVGHRYKEPGSTMIIRRRAQVQL